MPTLPPALRLVIYPVIFLIGLIAIGVAMALIVLVLTYPNLPSLEVLTDYRPKIPLRVYTADGFLIGEYGEERRAVVAIADVPAVMKMQSLRLRMTVSTSTAGSTTPESCAPWVPTSSVAASGKVRRLSPSRLRATSF